MERWPCQEKWYRNTWKYVCVSNTGCISAQVESRSRLRGRCPLLSSRLSLCMYGPRQAVQVFSGRSGFTSVLSAFKKMISFLMATIFRQGLPDKTASKSYPQWKLNDFDFTLNLRLRWPLSKNGRYPGTSLSDYDLMTKTCKFGVLRFPREAKVHVDESHEESREHSLLILAKTCHWEIPNWPTSSSPDEHQ